jgi:AraC-like DNA-binding protein
MDPVTDVLRLTRTRGAVLARVVAREPWGVHIAGTPGAAVHVMTAGTAWLRTGSQPPRRLQPGDVVLLPGGMPHTLSDRPTGRAVSFDRLTKRQLITPEGELPLGRPEPASDGSLTRFLCAGYEYDRSVAHQLMSALPDVVHVSAGAPGPEAVAVAAVLALLVPELPGTGAGSAAAVERLIDVLLVHVIRAWLRVQPEGTSWLCGLGEPVTARALSLMHEHPGHPWTADSIAAAVGVSRATLARRFTETVGRPPLGYLTDWRMDLAAAALRDTDSPVEAVARSVGYTSEPAFTRAFARHRGLPPGRWRSSARHAERVERGSSGAG